MCVCVCVCVFGVTLRTVSFSQLEFHGCEVMKDGVVEQTSNVARNARKSCTKYKVPADLFMSRLLYAWVWVR